MVETQEKERPGRTRYPTYDDDRRELTLEEEERGWREGAKRDAKKWVTK